MCSLARDTFSLVLLLVTRNSEEIALYLRLEEVGDSDCALVQVNFRLLHLMCAGEGGWVMHSPHMDGFKCSAMAYGLDSKVCLSFGMPPSRCTSMLQLPCAYAYELYGY